MWAARALNWRRCIIYRDKDPLSANNAGTQQRYALERINYDGTSFASVQLRHFLGYVREGWLSGDWTADGSNGWSSPTSDFGSYADNGSSVRESLSPWSVIGGQPSSFAWFGYLTSSGGFVYGQIPTENGGGIIGNFGPRCPLLHCQQQLLGNNSSMLSSFRGNSYVFNSTTDITGFGSLSVWDFTMNTGEEPSRAPAVQAVLGPS